MSPTPRPSAAPSFSPAVAGAVPSITVTFESTQTLPDQELAALEAAFLVKLQNASAVPSFDTAKMVVELSSVNPLTLAAFFRPVSGVDIAEAHAIAAAIQFEGSVVTPDVGATLRIVTAVAGHAVLSPTMSPTSMPTKSPSPSPTPSPSPAPSLRPTVAGAVPSITVSLECTPATLTGPKLAALKDAFLVKLQSASDIQFDTAYIVVELAEGEPSTTLVAFFRPGSGVDIAVAHAIATVIQYEGSMVTPADNGVTQCLITGAGAGHAQPSPTMSPTPGPSAAPSFRPAVAGAVPSITVSLECTPETLTGPKLAALKGAFLVKLQSASDIQFDTAYIVVERSPGELSSVNPITLVAFFRPGSGVDIAEAHAIATAIQFEGSIVAPADNGVMQCLITGAGAGHAQPSPTMSPTSTPTPSPTPAPTRAPSFRPTAAGTVPRILAALTCTAMTAQELPALKAAFLVKLQNASAITFDTANIVVELMSSSPLRLAAFFRPGSGVDFAEAHAIAAAIQGGGVMFDDNGVNPQCRITNTGAGHAQPSPTVSPSSGFVGAYTPTVAPVTPKPTPAPTPAPTCPPTTSLVEQDYCPCGYHDYGVRYNDGLGRITIVQTHQDCAARCNRYSGPQYDGGCRGTMTGMYMNMLFCRSYGRDVRSMPCPVWAKPDHPGLYSGALNTVRPGTQQLNVGGGCCSNTSFVDITG